MNESKVYPNLEVVTPEDRAELREALIGLESRRALAFQTAAVREFGPAGGIFARQLLFWDGKGRDPEGWIYKSMAEWQEETGLSRGEQEKARKRLAGTGKNNGKPVLEEKKAVGPDGRWRLFYRLDLAALMERVGEYLKPDEAPKPSTSTPVCSLKQTGSVSGLVDGDNAHLNVPAIHKSSQKKTQKDSPQTPQRGAKNERKGRQERASSSTTSFSGRNGSRRRTTASEEPATPVVAIEAIKASRKELARYWNLALEHNFADPHGAVPTGKVFMALGQTDDERWKNANSLGGICRRAVEESREAEGPTLAPPAEGAQTDTQREEQPDPFVHPGFLSDLEQLLAEDDYEKMSNTRRVAQALGKPTAAGKIDLERVAEALRGELNFDAYGLDDTIAAQIVLDILGTKASV